MKACNRWLLISALLSPYVLIFFVGKISLPPLDEMTSVIGATLLQATLSAIAALFFGFLGALGILGLNQKRTSIEFLVLVPSLIPALYCLIAFFNLAPRIPFGLPGIVFIHVLINIGLVSVNLAHLIETRLGRLAEIAEIEGATSLFFWFNGGLSSIRDGLFRQFLLVFILCFTSFLVPLTLGGGRFTTIEVLIFEKVRISGDLAQALGLSIIQSFFILFLTPLISTRHQTPTPLVAPYNRRLLQARLWVVIPLSITFLLMLGLANGFIAGVTQLVNLEGSISDFLPQVRATLMIGLLCGVVVFILSSWFLYWSPDFFTDRFLNSYIPPSGVMIGFSIVVIALRLGIVQISDEVAILSIAIGTGILVFPVIYRLRLGHMAYELKSQIDIANTLGASRGFIFKEVVLPQALSEMGWISGLAAFWATGEVALASLVAGRELTLPLAIRSLMGSYRLESATALTWAMFFVGALSYSIFIGLTYVARQKSYT